MARQRRTLSVAYLCTFGRRHQISTQTTTVRAADVGLYFHSLLTETGHCRTSAPEINPKTPPEDMHLLSDPSLCLPPHRMSSLRLLWLCLSSDIILDITHSQSQHQRSKLEKRPWLMDGDKQMTKYRTEQGSI